MIRFDSFSLLCKSLCLLFWALNSLNSLRNYRQIHMVLTLPGVSCHPLMDIQSSVQFTSWKYAESFPNATLRHLDRWGGGI